MNHDDHVALIRAGVEGAGPRWLELGAGEGAFTLALADVLGPGARIVAVDRDRRALDQMRSRIAGRFPMAEVEAVVADFTRGLPDGPFDGVLAANSLHFVAHPDAVLADISGRPRTRRPVRPGRVRRGPRQPVGPASHLASTAGGARRRPTASMSRA